MNEPRITVIIPTRERSDVLRKSLRTVTNQDYGNLRIIVSDNCSQDGTEEIVRSVKDPRVQYLNTGKRLSMSHNWEFALSHVHEGWVTIIGDDDGLLPASINKVADIIRSTNVNAVRSSVCSYLWPSLTDQSTGRLSVPLQSGHEVRNSQKWLSRVMAGAASYTQLPMLYNGGYVSVSVLNEMKSRNGSIYRSRIPDVYSAISIASAVETYIYLNDPLAINGASRHSTGISQFGRGEKLGASPASIFASEENIPFHEDVPLCADGSYPSSLQVMVYESFLQSGRVQPEKRREMHAKQLAIILASANRLDSSVADWARQFATKHDLDFKAINLMATARRPLKRVASALHTVWSTINTWGAGSPEFPIRDIHEASIAAGAIRNVGVTRLKNARRLIRRLLSEIKSI
jgi:glycosyltransferase involved in cell wall biosynthesis